MTPASLQAAQIAALKATRLLMPNGTRMFVNGQVIVITLSGQELKPGVPDCPSDQDIDAAIGQLNAMKSVAHKMRAQQTKATESCNTSKP